jgi:hypothetical protein
MGTNEQLEAEVKSWRQRIEARAYQIFLERGGEPGHALDDWLQAEEELVRAQTG